MFKDNVFKKNIQKKKKISEIKYSLGFEIKHEFNLQDFKNHGQKSCEHAILGLVEENQKRWLKLVIIKKIETKWKRWQCLKV